MSILEEYISSLLEFLIGYKKEETTIIRIHSRRLEQLGEISFPLNIKNWYHLIDKDKIQDGNIFQYHRKGHELDSHFAKLKENCKLLQVSIKKSLVLGNDVHLFLERSPILYKTVLINVLSKNSEYGSSDIFTSNIVTDCDFNNQDMEFSDIDLSTLRLLELKDVSSNFIALVTTKKKGLTNEKIIFSLNSNNSQTSILCGPVLNENGVKDNKTSAQELIAKRTMDMRLMAQHRYKVQVVPNTLREEYFLNIVKKLGRACATIEMLSNKPNKALKVTLNDLRTANKGAAFIFYNCARLSVLLKEFERRVLKDVYAKLPDVAEIDFAVLNQPEEWELFYVYILQFPIVVKSCIKDIRKGIFNPQYLTTFLSNLSSLFSAYYRRVKILTDPRDHLSNTLYARIFLLRALQIVVHNSLSLMNIEPIKEM